MTPESQDSPLLVSLQDRSRGRDAVAAHVAFGGLVGTDLVYFL